MKQYLHVEPVRSLAALLAFGAAVITMLALVLDWSGDVVASVQLVWSAAVALVATFFVRDQVTPE